MRQSPCGGLQCHHPPGQLFPIILSTVREGVPAPSTFPEWVPSSPANEDICLHQMASQQNTTWHVEYVFARLQWPSFEDDCKLPTVLTILAFSG